ncbi:elongation factor P hydroxylase [Marinobacter arenosus]|uniref:elongation factor P hydroxylase n=1 Tax=Marinobacter arenosus TaxID=2856822 RepID=UPI001C4B4D75|nr:elongation factor P hydroxylase [Marinobacter arenosus]MBW0146558.1 elongation factor P hydroxylase [Marinobacter arenosus]
MNHSPNDLIMLFNDLFREEYRTILVKGSDEPEYLPANEPDGVAQVVFAHGYYASALHEISHWCIAGERRRTMHDYGYWYCPDGRTPEQQRAFEQVEVKPQALEWLFSVAAGSRFHISVDNLSGVGAADEAGFRQKVRIQARHYLSSGMPRRAEQFFDALKTFYGTADTVFESWQEDAQRIAPASSALNIPRKIETV